MRTDASRRRKIQLGDWLTTTRRQRLDPQEGADQPSRVTYLNGLTRAVNRPRQNEKNTRFEANALCKKFAAGTDSAAAATCRKSGSFASDIVQFTGPPRRGKGHGKFFTQRSDVDLSYRPMVRSLCEKFGIIHVAFDH